MTNAKKDFTRLGLALFALAALTIVLQLAVGALFEATSLGAYAAEHELVAWLANFLPLYLVGVPVSLLIMKKVEKEEAPKNKLGVGNAIVYFLMCMGLFYTGNIIGTVISSILSAGTAENTVANLAINSGYVKIIFMVIGAPIIEELVFRKALIDRASKYGEKFAIVYSALAFGLFHMNLYQFFYAFFLGLIFGYIYAKTRNVVVTMIYHMIINIIGSVLAPIFINMVDADVLMQMSLGTASQEAIAAALPGIIAYYAYVVLLIVVSVAGIVLLIVKRKNFVYSTASQELTKNEFGEAAYANYGYILYAAVCMVFVVYSLIMNLIA